jgi:hypothetical protein
MRILASSSILSGPVSFRVPAGQYAGFALRVTGTNQAAQTLTAANIGNLTGTWRGVPILNIGFANLQTINNLQKGFSEFASSVGAAFRATAFYRATGRPDGETDGNVFDITDDDQLYINLDLSGVTGTIVASGTVQLFGIMSQGAQAYLPRYFQQSRNIASGATDSFDLPHDNISFVWAGTLTNLSRFQLMKDGNVFYQGSPTDMEALSNFENEVESEVTTSFLLPLHRSGALSEALSDSVSLLIDTSGGAGTPVIVDCCLDFTDDVLTRSRATFQTATNTTLNRKAALQKLRAVAVVQKVQSSAS